jgi:DNA-binding beta-propeller fold protein YncE
MAHHLAVTALLGPALSQTACFPGPDGNLYLLTIGQDGSRALASLTVPEIILLGDIFSLITSRLIAAPLELTGGLAGLAGGRDPQPSASPRTRAVYFLDTLGDSQVDGRVYAISINENGATLRGQVVLRPLVSGAPSLYLRHIAISRDGRLLIVSQSGNPPQWIFIDAASLTISGRLMAPPGVFPRRCVISQDGKRAYAVASGLQFDSVPQPLSVQILDTATRTIAGVIPVPANTVIDDWAITPDEGLLFAVGSRFLYVFDVATGTYSGRVDALAPVGDTGNWSGAVERLLMHPNGEKLYVSITRNPTSNFNLRTAAVGVFDTRTAQKLVEYPLRYPAGVIFPRMALAPSGQILFVGFQRGTEVQGFDTDSGKEIDPTPLEGSGFADLSVV